MASEYKQCECGNGFTTTIGASLCRICRQASGGETSSIRRQRREQNAPGSYTAKQWFNRIEFQNSLCFWCFKSLLDESKNFCGTKDHLIPLSRGGNNYIENIVAACWPCNREKGTKTATEYREYLVKRGDRISEFSSLPASTEKAFSFPVLRISEAPLELRDAIFELSRAKQMTPMMKRELLAHQTEVAIRREAAPLVFRGIDPTVRRAQLAAQLEEIQQRRRA